MVITRILIADDHPVVRDGLRGMLDAQEDLHVVADVGNGHQALAVLEAESVHLVLMDLRMPELGGVEAIRRIRAEHPDVNVLVLTTFEEDDEIRLAMDAGATGYLLKDAPREDLFDAVRMAARGQTVLAPRVAERLLRAPRKPALPDLTARELDVLRGVARGLTNRAIAAELHVSEATVKTHLVNAFTKLGVDDRTAAVMAALNLGLLRSEP